MARMRVEPALDLRHPEEVVGVELVLLGCVPDKRHDHRPIELTGQQKCERRRDRGGRNELATAYPTFVRGLHDDSSDPHPSAHASDPDAGLRTLGKGVLTKCIFASHKTAGVCRCARLRDEMQAYWQVAACLVL